MGEYSDWDRLVGLVFEERVYRHPRVYTHSCPLGLRMRATSSFHSLSMSPDVTYLICIQLKGFIFFNAKIIIDNNCQFIKKHYSMLN